MDIIYWVAVLLMGTCLLIAFYRPNKWKQTSLQELERLERARLQSGREGEDG